MTTSKAYSAGMLVMAWSLAVVLGGSAVAADSASESWWLQEESCSSCVGGLDSYECGDMSPLAMCPGGEFYFQSNLIAYRRDATQDELFQTRNTNTLTSQEVFDADGNSLAPRVFTLESSITRAPVLGTNDLDFQNSAGYRLLFGWKLADEHAIEFSYFDLNDWNEFVAVSDDTTYDVSADIDANGLLENFDTQPASLFSPFSSFGDPPIDVFDFNDLASIRYRSSLDNVELNVRHWITKRPSRIAVSVLWGGRFNAVREHFQYATTSEVPGVGSDNLVDVYTDNDLWGFQIGSQIDFCWEPRWHTEFEIKGGVAQNRTVLEGTYDIQDPGVGAPPYSGIAAPPYGSRIEKDTTSWIGEMRLTLVYQFGPHLTTHIGYEALVLSDLALASRNFETDLSILSSGDWVINTGGSVVYHGPSAGFTFAW